MPGQTLSTDVPGLSAELLDHSKDFVELVCQSAPDEYRSLLHSRRLQHILQQDNNFNFGQLFTYAEFLVFRKEFRKRFAGASAAACINAFSRLFLKNDISITNLVRFMEGSDERAQLYLNTPDSSAE